MGLLDFLLRRKKKPAAPASTLKEIWRGFQQVLALNNEIMILIGDLEEKLSDHAGLDLNYWRTQIDLLDRHFVDLVAALLSMSGGRWGELERSRVRVREAVRQRLREETCVYGPMLVRLEMADPELLTTLGGKAGNLARVKNQLGLPVPDAVVATLTAYRVFMQQQTPGREETLLARIEARLAALNLYDAEAVAAAALEIKAMILTQPLPPDLEQGLLEESQRLAAGHEPVLAVRSSGVREDLGVTFAGQYESFLGVSPEEAPYRWRQVVASQFGERALIYFKLQGLLLEDAAMGALVQRLVPARAAGVMFTTDPEGCDPDRVVVSAVWGLAADLVSGRVSADEFIVSKKTGRLLQTRLGRKEQCLARCDGSLSRLPVAPELVTAPALREADLEQLAGFARLLEGHFGCPQAVEWAQGQKGTLYVIQSRHLQHRVAAEPCRLRDEEPAPGAEVLLAGGRTGAPGVAAGPVFHLPEDRSFSQAPDGAILVAPHTTLQLAPLLPRMAAIITEVGSATGHLALVAREYGVPAVVDAPGAGRVLSQGQVVTVDADRGRVYRGRVEELLRRPSERPPMGPPPALEKFRAVLDLITPLTLVDRRNPNFRPENCRTYRDITRFAHEKAIQVMLGLMDSVAQGRVPALKLLKLKTDLPLNLHLVDLGDGLASYDTPVPPEKIISRPMRALWRGISHPDITWAGPVPVNLGGFLHVLGQSAIRPPEQFWDKTYAIVGANYVNYACRLGYHFQSVDSYLDEVPANNYIHFTFKGGAADDVRRIRRIRLIATVLEHLGFEMEIHGDIIRGRYRRRSAAETEERLDLLGRLMAFVRQMDMLMSDDDIPEILARRFLEGHYERPGQEGQSLK
jgi:pyruvate,water dikinase